MNKMSLWSIILLLTLTASTIACGGDDEDDLIPENRPNSNDNSSEGSSHYGVESVDLGLSVKWASMNVGANSSEEIGDLFGWGETETKSTFTLNNYKFYHTGYLDKDGVTIDSLYYDIIGNETYIEVGGNQNKTYDISKTQYDVAFVKWGGKWRIPTYKEMKELREKCTWRWASINETKGYKVTATNGNFIFLPANGFGGDKGRLDKNKSGTYASSTLVDKQSAGSGLEGWSFYGMDFKSSEVYLGEHGRLWGFSVRPVMDY